MEIRWLEKNVDLHELKEAIKQYFKRKGFKISTLSSANKIYAKKKANDVSLAVEIEVKGHPQDFSVKISCLNAPESIHLFSNILSMIGLGGLMLKKLKILDIYREYERDFEAFIEETVNSLSKSKPGRHKNALSTHNP